MRIVLAAVGILGFIAWLACCVLAYGFSAFDSPTGLSLIEIFFGVGIGAAFVFYVIAAIRQPPARAELAVGILIQIQTVLVAVWLLTVGHAGPFASLVLFIGPVVWGTYMYRSRLRV